MARYRASTHNVQQKGASGRGESLCERSKPHRPAISVVSGAFNQAAVPRQSIYRCAYFVPGPEGVLDGRSRRKKASGR